MGHHNPNLGKNYVVGIYDDDLAILSGVKSVRDGGVNIQEVYTPFPVHGLEHVLGYKKTRLPIVAFLFAMTGMTLAIVMQVGMMVFDWPMIIGGKPAFAYPDFLPVTFELSILLTAFGMVGTFMIISDLKPHKIAPRLFDKRCTDDKHVMAVDLAANSLSEDEIKQILEASGASEVTRKDFE